MINKRVKPWHKHPKCIFSAECANFARSTKLKLCIKHGGGQRCTVPYCDRGARYKTDKCFLHGGGQRCTVLNCTTGADNSTMKCRAHGSRLCIIAKCVNRGQGSTHLCKSHQFIMSVEKKTKKNNTYKRQVSELDMWFAETFDDRRCLCCAVNRISSTRMFCCDCDQIMQLFVPKIK